MYGHVPQYLDAERLRLRAERAELWVRRWRVTAWLLFVCAISSTWLVIDTALELGQTRQAAADQRAKVAVWTEQTADLQQALRADRRRAESELRACHEQWSAVDMPTVLSSQQAADIDDARLAAERKFHVCLSANAGLVDALHEFDALVKEQQSVIRESIDIARRCDAQPVNWVNLNEVR